MQQRTLCVLAFGLVLALHLSVRQLYGIHGVDDAWTLSFDYFYFYDGFEFDKVFEHGLGVVAYFGKTHAFIYGNILDWTGWKRGNAQLISALLIVGSALLWLRIAIALGYGKYAALSIALLFLLLDPFMSTANKARPEALAFFLLSLSVFLTSRQQYLLAGMMVGLSIETHPMGIFSIAYVAAFLMQKFTLKALFLQHRRVLVQGIIGLLVGLLYYLLLHYQHLQTMLQHIESGDGESISTQWFLIQHFFHSRYQRHLPEFLIFFCYIFLFFYAKLYRTKAYRFACFSLILVLVFSLFIGHGNKQYGIYLYPALIFMVMSVAERYKKMSLTVVMFLFLMIPQYAFIQWKFGGFEFEQYLTQVRRMVPQDERAVCGHPNHWFAFNHGEFKRPFYGCHTKAIANIDGFYLVRDLQFESMNQVGKQAALEIIQSPNSRLISEAHYQDHKLMVYAVEKN